MCRDLLLDGVGHGRFIPLLTILRAGPMVRPQAPRESDGMADPDGLTLPLSCPLLINGEEVFLNIQDKDLGTYGFLGYPVLQSADILMYKADYVPGSTVTMSGDGWQAGETVTLTLAETPPVDTHGPFSAVADANGEIVRLLRDEARHVYAHVRTVSG